jgi:IclR family acetate operon transcriptional repressor
MIGAALYMATKRSQAAARVLSVLEKVAAYQPISMSELARILGADKSTVHRALMTLSDEGWIRPVTGRQRGWELTARIYELGQLAQGHNDLRNTARHALQTLRDQTGETCTLNVVERDSFVVFSVVESRHPLRVVLAVGDRVQALRSATGRAVLPFLNAREQLELLGQQADAAELREYALVRERGYSVSSGIVVPGFSNIAAPVFRADGQPLGAVVVTGPSDRMRPETYGEIGALAVSTARLLSRGVAPALPPLEAAEIS